MSSNPFNNLTKNDILDAFSSLFSNDGRTGNPQANLNFLNLRNAAPSALSALQGYAQGRTAPSPSWNINDHSAEPSSTPSHTFSGLNLNSVDEEDEFLYGDSNSVPEEQTSVQNKTVISNTGRLDTGWSDEEDLFDEARGATLNKLNSRLKKNLSDYDSQTKIQERIKFPPIRREEILIEDTPPAAEVHEQRYVSQKLEPRQSVSSPVVEKNEFPEISTSVKDKSKYHIAAELLKKRNVEKKNAVNISSSEKLDVFPGTSRNVPELHADLKTDKPALQRQNPRIINKKHVDNIRDYIAGPQRKRSHPPEEFSSEKRARYETSRSFSPSRRHSPHMSSLSSNKYKSSERDHTKYESSYSSRRSPSYDSEKRHSRYTESRRRYSPSPKRYSRSPDYRHRRSHEKSTGYNKYKDRSRRSRSRSPGYYSSKSKTSDKKTSYSKKKGKSGYSSGDSFCSLSLGSSSSSSDSSDESSDEKKSSKKPVKTVPIDNKKVEDEMANLKGSDNTYSKMPDSSTLPTDDLSKKISDIFGVDVNMLDPGSINRILSAVQPPDKEHQLLINILEQKHQLQQQHQLNQQHQFQQQQLHQLQQQQQQQLQQQQQPLLASDSLAYSPVPSASVQYVPPHFSPIIPAATFPAPVMATPPAPVMPTPPAEYGAYLQMSPVPSNESQYVKNLASKSGNVRPATLRTIPLSDSLPIVPADPRTKTNNIAIVPNSSSLPQPAAKAKIQESKSSLQYSKQPSEKKTINLKEKVSEKDISSSSRLTKESTSEQSKSTSEQKKISNSEQNKLLIIEKFKKMKAERAKALNKAESASQDLNAMRHMLDATFGKKIGANEKVIYSKCKNQFNFALDMASQKNKEARRADENLNNFKARLPTALQAEVSKIKLEQCLDEPDIKEKVSCLDQGDHLCSECYLSFNDIKEMLNHIQTAEHKKQMESSAQDWKRHFVKEQKEDAQEHRKTLLKPVKGAEFVKPLSGFYCALCKEIFLDESSVEQHLKGHHHYVNYDNFNKGAPLYERKRLFKRFIKMAVAAKEKKIVIVDDTKEEEEKKKNQEQKKNQEAAAAERKSKEILLKEKSKEVKVIELEDEDSEDLHPSSNQKAANIKLNLSEKDKDKSTKFVFIGKAPNYKKPQPQKPPSEKPKPWYKRNEFLNIKESDADTSSNVTKAVEKVPKKCQSPDVGTFKSTFKNVQEHPPNSTKKPEEAPSSKSSLCHKDKTSVVENKDPDVKQIKKSQVENKDPDVKQIKKSQVENKNPDVKQIKKSQSDSFAHNIKLSEIALPETSSSSLPSSSNANVPQPMDIDNSQDVKSKPKSEEEKDFLLLSINKEDFQPLVVPIPPPTSMVSYPVVPSLQTVSSNINCVTSSASTIQNKIIKNLDLSVPPPTISVPPPTISVPPPTISVPPPNIAPYQNNSQHMSIYGNQNNTQNIPPYSYPTNNPQMSAYSNSPQISLQTNYQNMLPYSTPPPAYRNPPPVLPYSNTGNIPPGPQYSYTNNMSYNTYSNSVSANQSYEPPMYPLPSNNQTQYPIPNASQNLVPPGSESIRNNNTKINVVTTNVSTHVPQSKTSPTLQKAGNLIRIVPENTKLKVSESGKDNKPIKLEKTTPKINVQDSSKKVTANIPAASNVAKGIKSVVKHEAGKTSNAVKFNAETLKTSKIVGNIEKSSNANSNGQKKTIETINSLLKQSMESQIKHIIYECIKKIELKEQGSSASEKEVKSSLTIDMPVVFNSSASTNQELIKSEQMPVNETSKIKSEQMPVNEISKIKSEQMPVNEISKTKSEQMPVNEISKTKSEQMPVNETSKIKPEQMSVNETSKIKSEETSINEASKSKSEQMSFNEVSNIKSENKIDENVSGEIFMEICEKQISAKNMEVDGAVLGKSSDNNSSLVDNSNKGDEITDDKENNNDSVTTKIAEKVVKDNVHATNTILKENTENAASDSMFSTSELARETKENEDTVIVKADEKMIEDNAHDSETILKDGTKNATNDSISLGGVTEDRENKADDNITENNVLDIKSVLKEDTQNVINSANESSHDENCKVNPEENYDKQMDAEDDIVVKKSSIESCFSEESSSNEVHENDEDVEMTSENDDNKNSENDFEGKNLKTCPEQIPGKKEIKKKEKGVRLVWKFKDGIWNKFAEGDDDRVNKSSINFSSLEDNSSKADKVGENIEDTELSNEKNIGGSIHDSKGTLKQNTENVQNDSVPLKHKQVNVEEGILIDSNDVNKKSIECHPLTENSIEEKGLETLPKQIESEMNDLKFELLSMIQSGETDDGISSDNLYSAAGDKLPENKENMEVTLTVSEDKIIEDNVFDEEIPQEQNTENGKNDSVLDSSFYEIFKVNHEVGDKLVEESDNITLEKSTEYCFLTEDSSNNITEKSEDVEMPDVSSIVEDENIGDSCTDKKTQNEDTESHVSFSVGADENNVSEENKTLPSTEILPMSVDGIVDSNQKDSNVTELYVNILAIDKNEISEDSNLKCEEGMSDQDLKGDNNSELTSSNVKKQKRRKGRRTCSKRVLKTDVNLITNEDNVKDEPCINIVSERQTRSKKLLKTEVSVISKEEIVKEEPCINIISERQTRSKRVLKSDVSSITDEENVKDGSNLKCGEGTSGDLNDGNNSQLISSNVKKQRGRRGRKTRGKKVLKTHVTTEENAKDEPPSLCSNPDAVKENNQTSSGEEEKFESISSQGGNLEDFGMPTLEKVTQDIDMSEDKVQDTHLKLVEKSEDSRISENEAKASSFSGSQDSEKCESKDEASAQSATEEKEKAGHLCSSKSPKKSSSDIKNISASDTEEYEDDDDEDEDEEEDEAKDDDKMNTE